MSFQDQLVRDLALKAIQMSGNESNGIERCCWMIVHEYRHGVMPVEYDIRDIDETLYLNVLNYAREKL